MSKVSVTSEINTLKKVIIHTPGRELELMTPETAEEVLYDDILNLQNARNQHSQLSGVLEKVAQPFQVKDLLLDILKDSKIHNEFINTICTNLNVKEYKDELMNLSAKDLANQIIVGTELKKDTLENYLSRHHFAIPPLPNLFFTRDAAMVVNKHALIGNMATAVRTMETLVMRYIFHYHPELDCEVDHLVDTTALNKSQVTFEGGDVLIVREDTILIGMSERTSPGGIDYLIEHFKRIGKVKNIFVVMLPKHRAWIHLDMVFTMVDKDKAVVFPDLINESNAVDVIHVNISNPEKPHFSRHDYLLDALKKVGINLHPIYCGGQDSLYQQREQWQSGANFFTIAPGKVIGYGMNYYTFDELEKAGIPRIEARDVIEGLIDLSTLDKYAIAMKGNELTRGGGGCRCMTMPILREE
ncbi:MAG: arginine deiminase [Calditrichaeota bacterium]|nr:MAG: arginine deiminase [Calditrichota bacterium]MBL1204579.1 arginine deiminase [Calditrichota bacterium]NOG44408.1 arginine deiminase [Calditrichota bacterium]